MQPRVVVDSSVLRAGFASGTGASRVLLLAAIECDFVVLASTALMLQYEDVLLRPGTLAAARATTRDALDFLDDFCAVCLPVALDVLWRPQSPDGGDDLVLDAAVNGMADTIATFDLRHIRGPAARFGVAAETPADVLRRIA